MGDAESELGLWVDCSQCSPDGLFRVLHICINTLTLVHEDESYEVRILIYFF